MSKTFKTDLTGLTTMGTMSHQIVDGRQEKNKMPTKEEQE